jgi:hypothetical protein
MTECEFDSMIKVCQENMSQQHEQMISLMARIKIVDELKLVERINGIDSRVKLLEANEGKLEDLQ